MTHLDIAKMNHDARALSMEKARQKRMAEEIAKLMLILRKEKKNAKG